MQIDLPSGTRWHVRDAARKLTLRAGLPGARVFDLCAEALRHAKGAGVAPVDRFNLALPASWLVNSPAISRVLRRWALPPHRETCLALLDVLDDASELGVAGDETEEAIALAIRSLGEEPYVIEATSKIFALLTPEAVPLMPVAARAFVLGPGPNDGREVFGRIARWFAATVAAHADALNAVARAHTEVELVGAQVLDRLLWFDSEGHTHLPPIVPTT